MEVALGFGKEKINVTVPDSQVMAVLKPNECEIGLTGSDEVYRSMREPIGLPPLREIVKKGEKIAIITSDITRPIPSYKVLPAVLDELAAAGIPDEDITIVFALGSHGGHTEERMRYMVGDAVFDRKTVDRTEFDPAAFNVFFQNITQYFFGLRCDNGTDPVAAANAASSSVYFTLPICATGRFSIVIAI